MCRIIFNFFHFYYAGMRRKLWPKAPAKDNALGQMSKNFQVYFIHINFFKKPNKKFTIEPKSYTAMLLYLFFDSLLSTCPKKWKLKMAQGCRLSPILQERCCCYLERPYSFSGQSVIFNFFYFLDVPSRNCTGHRSVCVVCYTRVKFEART